MIDPPLNQPVLAVESQKNSLVSVDVARAFAAFSVFVYHYGIGHVAARVTHFQPLEWIALPGAVFAVPLFFAISGFCIHGAEWHRYLKSHNFDWRAYAVRRFRRIYPAYTFTLGLSFVLHALSSKEISGSDLLIHALLLQGFSSVYFNTINLVLWTISVECCFYLIYPFWLRLRITKGAGFAFAAGLAITIVSWIVTAVRYYPYSVAAQWFFLNTWVGWLAGALLAERLDQGRWLHEKCWWIVGAFVWIVGLLLLCNDAFLGRFLILQRPFVIMLSLWPLAALVAFEKWFKRKVEAGTLLVVAFAAIGLSSYSLYLLHVPLVEIRFLIEPLFHQGLIRLAFQITWFFVILALCWLSYRQIELRFMKTTRRAPVIQGP